MKKKVIFNKEQFIEDYNELKSSRKMAKKYNCTKDAILSYAKEIGYVNEINPKLTEDDIKFILENYDKKHQRNWQNNSMLLEVILQKFGTIMQKSENYHTRIHFRLIILKT